MIQLLVKLPTRERPQQLWKVLMELKTKAMRHETLHFLFSLDADDPCLEQNKGVIESMCSGIAHTVVVGTSTSKIHAINRDINEFPLRWETLLIASDDMVPTDYWDVYAMDGMKHFYPDGDGVLWYYDGYQRDITTIPLMGNAYYRRTMFVYDPRFKSVFADNLQTDIARMLGKLTKQDHVLMRHAHPANDGTVKADDLHKRNETQANWDHDKAIYEGIVKAGFPMVREHKAAQRFSQSNEQDIILDYFGPHMGAFLDLGSNDGITLSNTRELALRGWCGVLVDASPAAFERLQANCQGLPNMDLHHAAIHTENGRITLQESGAHLGTDDVALLSTTNPEEAAKWEPTGATFLPVEVEAVTVLELYTRARFKRFDLISIDIEGADLEALQQMDLTELGCRMLIVEVNDRDVMPYVEHCAQYGLKLLTRNAENLIFAK